MPTRINLIEQLADWYAAKTEVKRALVYPFFVVVATSLIFPSINVLSLCCGFLMITAKLLDWIAWEWPATLSAFLWPYACFGVFAMAVWPIKVIGALVNVVLSASPGQPHDGSTDEII